jgi:hypothetical protein
MIALNSAACIWCTRKCVSRLRTRMLDCFGCRARNGIRKDILSLCIAEKSNYMDEQKLWIVQEARTIWVK